MPDPLVDRDLGELKGRVASLERWMDGMSEQLDAAKDSNHELVTEVALMRQSVDRLAKATKGIEEMRGAGRVVVSILLAIGSIVGAVAGVVGGAWLRKLFGLE